MRRTALPTVFLSLLLLVATFGLAQTDHTRQIDGRNDISDGLPQDASFNTVEVADTNGDGLDEIYLGGAGRNNPKTQGIRSYQYDMASGTWEKFGSGLPGGDSGKYYGALGIGDVDGDLNMDLVAPIHTKWYDGNTNGLEIYTGDGSGNFDLDHTIDCGESTSEVELADLDGDGNMDIAASTLSGARAWFGSGSASSWNERSPGSVGQEGDGIAVGDLNGDGLLDLALTIYTNTHVRFYVQTPARTWEEHTFDDIKGVGFGIKIADLDLDGNADILWGTRGKGVRAWLGNGGGSRGGTDFQWTDASAGLHDSGQDWTQLELADITGDGRPELLSARSSGGTVHLYLNDLPNGWAEILTDTPLDGGGSAYGANFGDWDGDDEYDCAACSWGSGADAWILTGEGTAGTGEPDYPAGGKDPSDITDDDDSDDDTGNDGDGDDDDDEEDSGYREVIMVVAVIALVGAFLGRAGRRRQ